MPYIQNAVVGPVYLETFLKNSPRNSLGPGALLRVISSKVNGESRSLRTSYQWCQTKIDVKEGALHLK